MSRDWLEKLESHLPPRVEQAVKDADKAIHNLSMHVHLSHWHPISTAPCNQELELRVAQDGETTTLEFPCLQTNAGEWINVDLGSAVMIQPVEWRIWQRNRSPQPHHSKISASERPAAVHPVSAKQITNSEDGQ